jgi:hypothetical protein
VRVEVDDGRDPVDSGASRDRLLTHMRLHACTSGPALRWEKGFYI